MQRSVNGAFVQVLDYSQFCGNNLLQRAMDLRHHRIEERDMDELPRITQSPHMMGGRACIRGMRVTVGMIVGQIGAGHTVDAVLADYPYLEREDVLQALRYAAWKGRT